MPCKGVCKVSGRRGDWKQYTKGLNKPEPKVSLGATPKQHKLMREALGVHSMELAHLSRADVCKTIDRALDAKAKSQDARLAIWKDFRGKPSGKPPKQVKKQLKAGADSLDGLVQEYVDLAQGLNHCLLNGVTKIEVECESRDIVFGIWRGNNRQENPAIKDRKERVIDLLERFERAVVIWRPKKKETK